MSTPSNPYYVTTPIYYVNDRPHIGHVYTTTVADVLARYHRLAGHETFFLTGTDEHAAKVVDSAAEHNVSTQAWADQNAEAFEQTFAKLGMSNDDFIRTSQDRHKERVTRYVQALLDSGDVYLGDYEGWYDAGQEEYVPENKAKEYEFNSPINGKPLVRKTEKNYFFKLKAYRQPLLDFIKANPLFVQPNARRNEIVARIEEAEDVPISRTGAGEWCIKVPGDEDHGIYVWIDALFNYLTTIDTDDRRHLWPCNVHLIAKDILWFHAAIWPAMLMALKKQPGFEWVEMPGQVYTHSFWIAEGKKMSKSLGNFVDLEKIDSFVETFGLDALRWFLATQGPLGVTDADFAQNKFIETYNADLANTFGNSASRVTNMTNRYFEGVVPEDSGDPDSDTAIKQVVADRVEKYHQAMQQCDLGAAGSAALEIIRAVDGYIETTQPFKMAKDPDQLPQVGTILNVCAEAIRITSILLWPFMPNKMPELWKNFGLDYSEQLSDNGTGQLNTWTTWGGLKPGSTISKGDALFPRHQPAKDNG